LTNSTSADSALPPLPQAVTSFGAAMLDGAIYVHGGHCGQAHHYSMSGQSDEIWRLDVDGAPDWQTVDKARRLQGHAMVAHGDSLYVVGGFTARNTDDEEQDLWSMADFARFQPGDRQWTELTPLPDGGNSWQVARKLPSARFFHRMLPLDERRLVLLGGANMQQGKFRTVDVVTLPD
jgi:N-acetylneuraminic acid mutarotase